MFKVSFKKDCKKVETFNNKVTIVTLKGTVKHPKWWYDLPISVTAYLDLHSNVGYYVGLNNDTIEVSGKSVCSTDDQFDPVFGERIAEARAKLRLYKTLYVFLKKVYRHYYSLLYGNSSTMMSYHENISGISGDVHRYEKLYAREKEHLSNLLEMS